ncbi:ABC protein [Mycena kentingensis (nom. inval.)]|nr:ABC protein [Mycena kentingensis (nom. inval.)]
MTSAVASVSTGERVVWDAASGARLLKLISSNEPPLDPEIPAILDVLSALDATFQSEALSARRAELRSVLSPLRRLPPALLAEIFRIVIPPKDTESRLDLEFSIASAPWVFTHVCARWRSVAICTQSLWSHVAVVFFAEADSTPYPPQLLAMHLERGNNFAVNFQGWQDLPLEPQRRVFELLVQHAENWVELFVVLTQALVPTFNTLRGRLARLQKVRLEWSGSHSPSAEDPFSVQCLEDAPCLSEVRILNDDDLVPTPFNFANLTWYSLDAPWRTHVEILKAASTLETAYIHIDFDSNWPDWTESVREIIRMPRLRRLYVSDAGILDHLDAPVITDIALRTGGDEPQFLAGITSFVDRSARGSVPTIKSIRIAGIPAQRGIVSFFEKFSTVEEWRLIFDTNVNPDASWQEIRAIFDLLKSSTLLQTLHLRRIFLLIHDSNYLDWASFLGMVCARVQDARVPLDRVELVTQVQADGDTSRQIGQELAYLRESHDLQYVYTDGDQEHTSAGSVGDKWLFYDSL